MSLLAPLYIGGLLAIGVPLIFHLIRRTPQGRVPFSSLMFLRPSPPRMTKRRRLDQWPLLLLRAVILTAIALAFARPFLREGLAEGLESPRRLVALLVDTSASMGRDGIRTQVVQAIEEELSDAAPQDLMALFTFDDEVIETVGFDETKAIPTSSAKEVLLENVKSLVPRPRPSDVGTALVRVADRLEALQAESEGTAGLNIILISDLQEGSDLSSLHVYDWPQAVQVKIRALSLSGGNAGLHPIGSAEIAEDPLEVRITNSVDHQQDIFHLQWRDSTNRPLQAEPSPIRHQVPPGESRVVRVSPPDSNASSPRLTLIGDDHPFDNTIHWSRAVVEPREVVYLSDRDDGSPRGLHYYLDRVFAREGLRPISVIRELPPDPEPSNIPLVVLGAPFDASLWTPLRGYIEKGGVLLAVFDSTPHKEPSQQSLRLLLDEDSATIRESTVGADYAMLTDVDFESPLFRPFADPRFSDFTSIRFWKYRSLSNLSKPSTKVLARFGKAEDPFLLERPLGTGRIVVATSGWSPLDSQLARSTKFPALMNGFLRMGPDLVSSLAQLSVGDSLPRDLPHSHLVLPDGSERALSQETDLSGLIEEPGLYRLRHDGTEKTFAVNLTRSESATTSMDPEEFARLGLSLGSPESLPSASENRLRHDLELENEQRLWRTILLVAMGLLIFEIWLSGRLARKTLPLETST